MPKISLQFKLLLTSFAFQDRIKTPKFFRFLHVCINAVQLFYQQFALR